MNITELKNKTNQLEYIGRCIDDLNLIKKAITKNKEKYFRVTIEGVLEYPKKITLKKRTLTTGIKQTISELTIMYNEEKEEIKKLIS